MKTLLYYGSRIIDQCCEMVRVISAVLSNAGSLERKGRLVIKKNAKIEIRDGGKMVTGNGTVTIQSGTRIVIEDGGRLFIGNDVGINSNCYIAVHKEICIGNNTIIGPGVVIVDQDHDYKADGGLKSEKYKVGSVDIGDNVWVGANSVILRDTNIGENTVIGAGSVVKGNIPEGTKYLGAKRGN